MKKYFLFLFLLISSLSFGQSWLWGATGYGSQYTNDEGSPVAADKNGNAYITGVYYQSITFGSHTLSCSVQNSYLVKYDSSGNILWAVQPSEGANSDVYAAAIATDESGNIYITGGFYGRVTFGSYVLTNGADGSLFLAKYSPSGSVLWAKQAIATSYGMGTSLAIDKSGNIFITGNFEGGVLIFGSDTLRSQSMYNYSMFVVKYDSSANVLWVKQPKVNSNSGGLSEGTITTDKIGNAYVTGSLYDTVSFGTDTLISPTGYSVFLVKYSASGNVSWVKQSENVSLNGEAVGIGVVTDGAKNIYTTGYFNASVKFGSQSLYSPSTYSFQLVKYDTNGNVIWAKQSSPGWMGLALATDKYSNIYMCGISYYNDDTLKYGNYTLTTGPWVSYASYLLKVDTSGNPICGSMLENLGYSSGEEIATDSYGNYVYMAGTFEDDTVICGKDKLISTGGNENVFVGRWLNCSSETGINNVNSPHGAVSIFPNPNNGVFTLRLNSEEVTVKSNIEVYNMMGEQVYNKTLIQPKAGEGDNLININNQPAGVYLYRVLTETGSFVAEGKIIIEH